MTARFEARALGSYTLLAADLAVFRILYAAFVLLAVVPVAAWLPLAPRAFFHPPIGPAALLTGPPPPSVLLGLNVGLSLFAVMLLVGWKTGVASVGTGLTLFVLNAWAYSLGKINHDILMVVTPLVLGLSGWGRALSVDATRHPPAAGERAEAWPVALLALLVGFAMFTAAWAKATTGWLDPQLRCTYGHLVRNYLFLGRETWAASLALGVDSAWFWKAADWFGVVLEAAFLPAALHRRSFCLILAVATLFHLGILLLFDIPFSVNIIVFGAFVRYTAWPFLRVLFTAAPLTRSTTRLALVAAITLGLVAILRVRTVAVMTNSPVHAVVVWVGAVVGVVYLCRLPWDRRRR